MTIISNMVKMPFKKMKFLARALKYRDYRLFFMGQGLSLAGTWMQQVAVSWLIYRMTKSAFLLGFAGFAGQLPSFLVMPIAGVLVDRYNHHKILIITQALAMLQALILTTLFMTGNITVTQVILLSALLGLIGAFDIPARHALVFDLVENKKDLSNAIALNSSIFNIARLIGPLLAGVLIATMGEGSCFFINFISYLAVIAALMAMKVKINKGGVKHPHVLKGLSDGLKYAFRLKAIKYILILVAAVSFFGVPYMVLLPLYSTEVLHQGPEGFGLLMTSAGLGALAGAVYLAWRKNVMGLDRSITVSLLIFGAGLAMFSFCRSFIFALILMALIGLGMMVQMAGGNTIIQTIVDSDKRGRIMSLYAMAFIGVAPFGSLFIGSLASRIGVQYALAISGAACILSAIIFAGKLPEISAAVHPVYKAEYEDAAFKSMES